MAEQIPDALQRKAEIRAAGLAARQRQPHRQSLSRTIVAGLCQTDEYRSARVVLYYVSVPSEVHTLRLLAEALADGKTVVVPYMEADRIELFRLESLDDLAPGHFNILEPRRELRTSDRAVSPAQVELVIVPGVGFDQCGGRVGHGKGYYDEFLRRVRPETPRIGLAYECQIFNDLPMLPHDIPMHKVITERTIYAPDPAPTPLNTEH